MARKASSSQVDARGFGDIIGIVLISIAVLALVACLGYASFFAFGAGAYLLPILLFCFGLSYLFPLMAYFHRRWLWAPVLLFCCMGLLDLNTNQNALLQL